MEIVTLPARGVRPLRGWGRGHSRVLAAVLICPAAAGLAVAGQWPAIRADSVHVALNVAVTVAFIGTGIALAGRDTARGIGGLLVLAGALWSTRGLRTWDAGVLPVVSVEVGTMFWVVLGWGCLRYPGGRLHGRAERAYVAAISVILPVLSTAGIIVSRPAWNGLRGHVWWPAPLADLEAFRRVVLATGITAFVLSVVFSWLIIRRLAHLRPAEQRVLGPAGGAIVVAGIFTGVLSIVRLHTSAQSISAIVVAICLALLGLPLAVAVASVRERIARAALADLLVLSEGPPTAESVRNSLADVLSDDSLEVLYPLPDADVYVDGRGRAVALPAETDGRLLVAVRSATGETLGVVHADGKLRRRRERVDVAVSVCGLALENARLQAVMLGQLAELRASRARIVEAGFDERRNLERNLHDGAQQRLLALGTRLGLARAQTHNTTTIRAIDEARADLHAALRELRELARGIHPTVLGHAGLAVALDSMADTWPIPVDITVTADRADHGIEAVAYRTVIEVLGHVARGGDAARANVTVTRSGGDMLVRVSHPGPRTDGDETGHALSIVADRLHAVDGAFTVSPATDPDTYYQARIPCA